MPNAMEDRSLYTPVLATIADMKPLTATEKLFRIKLNSGKNLDHKPGQFVEVSVFGVGEAPISVSSSPTARGFFDLGIRRVGNVTRALHNMEAGAVIGIRGPFGKHFPYDEARGRDILFVAGGIGLAPLRSFINYALDNRKDYGTLTILFGAKTPAERLYRDELEIWASREDVEYMETVDRGDATWRGNTGVITNLFTKIDPDPRNTVCIVVGPPIMYKFVIAEAKKKGIPDESIILSLERHMKCGVGKCGHCQINNLYCCQDGPVFRYSDVKPIPEAF